MNERKWTPNVCVSEAFYGHRQRKPTHRNINIFCSKFIFHERMSECAAKVLSMVIYLDTYLVGGEWAREREGREEGASGDRSGLGRLLRVRENR